MSPRAMLLISTIYNACNALNPNTTPVDVTDQDLKRLLAWNCDLQQTLEFSEFSLMRVETCKNVSSNYKKPIKHNGQLIKSKSYEDLDVLECIIKSSFFVAYCSYSLISGFRQWDSQSQLENVHLKLTRSECESAMHNGILKYQDRNYFDNMEFIEIPLSPANTASGWKLLRGQSDAISGTCVPDNFQLGRHSFPSHVLNMKYEVSIKYIPAVFNTEKRLIRINHHTVIPTIEVGSYYSPTLGNYYWESIHQGNLSDALWQEISKGEVMIYFPKDNKTMPIAIIDTSNNSSFAISLTGKTMLCLSWSCRETYKTQIKDTHLVIFSLTGQSHWPLAIVGGSEIDRLISLEAVTSSLYLHNELRLSHTFERISLELCKRNRETILSNIQNYITNVLTQQNTEETSNRYFIRAGSVLYSIKCLQTIAWLRNNDTYCYEDAPIFYKDKNNDVTGAFLNPISYVITPRSKKVNCNSVLPFKINIMALDGSTEWICKGSSGWTTQCSTPKVLKPMHPGHLYETNDKLIISSLYTSEQLASLTELQWAHVEKEINMKEWEEYMDKIRKNNPNIQPINYFEHLHKKMKAISDLFDLSTLMKYIVKNLLPIVLINYIFNVLINLFGVLMMSRKFYKASGLSIRFVLRCMASILMAMFPLNFTFQGESKTHTDCNCSDDAFIDELVTKIEQKERQRFLSNLRL